MPTPNTAPSDTATTTEYLSGLHPNTTTPATASLLVETTFTPTRRPAQVQKRVVYTLGHDRLSQTTTTYTAGEPTATETLHFGQDGHGSTLVLLDALGAIAIVAGVPQVFHYAAHGTPLGFDPSTAATTFLYSGEQTDATGLQYLRARYYNPATGRFNRLDPFSGDMQDPQSLHKYLYCHADPVMGIDPNGLFFSLLLGALFDTNLQSMAINGYDAAFQLAETGLQAMDSYYNLKILRALNANDPFASPWVKNAMCVLPVLAMIAQEGGETISVSRIMNMTSADWKVYIQKTYGYLAPGNMAGHVAEELAKGWLKSRGCTDILPIQNASGHGIDMIAKHTSGQWVAFEVKGHIEKGTARVRGLAEMGAKGFAENVLKRIADKRPGWGTANHARKAAVDALTHHLATDGRLRGIVINVEHALDAVSEVIKTKLWKKFVR